MAINNIKSLVFLDLETTGLGSKCKITEMALVAVQRDHFNDTVYSRLPRVQNKLTLCIYPQKPVLPWSSNITGLHNENLYNQKPFDESVFVILNQFLERLESPICLFAHNGNSYDFKLLQAEIAKINCSLSSNILCSDTLMFFRMITKQIFENNSQVGLNKPEVELFTDEELQIYLETIDPLPDVLSTPGTPKNSTSALPSTFDSPVSVSSCPGTPINSITSAIASSPSHNSVRRRLFDNLTSNVNGASNQLVNTSTSSPQTEIKKKYQSCSLSNLHKLFFKKIPENAHRAEDDCLILMKICHLYRQELCEWADKYAVPINNIPLMWT